MESTNSLHTHSLQLNGELATIYQSGDDWILQLLVKNILDDATFLVDIISLRIGIESLEIFQPRIGQQVSLAVRPYFHKQSKQIRYTLVNPRLFYSEYNQC